MLEIDYYMSLIKLQEYTDEELYHVLECAEHDKNEFFRAACTYWMCIMEIGRRKDNKYLKHLDIKCITNIFDNNHEIIFRLGNHYKLYEIDKVIIVYSDKLIPYIFTIVEEDTRCVWKYFGLWKDNNRNIHS